MKLRFYPLLAVLLFGFSSAQLSHAEVKPELLRTSTNTQHSFKQDAQLIKAKYEAALFTLTPYTFAHFGLRMYRQTQDPKYALSLWVDAVRIANSLSKFANEVETPEQVHQYSLQKLNQLKGKKDERSKRRYQATLAYPEYLFLGINLLSNMARANEFGLKHQQDAKLRAILRRYDFAAYASAPEMIKAWAAQLANQVYWLRQLGEQDVVAEFTKGLRLAYPDARDHLLSEQQFNNKIYGLSHIIFADSQYYLHPVKESDHQWIYDYYRNNIDEILKRCKEDVIAEVGINFLLAQLDNDPVVLKTRIAISAAIDRQHHMVPSVTGDLELERGEHRNVLAIMLLDWQGFLTEKSLQASPDIVVNPPYGLVRK
ncbi:DUF3541 domain-containing protein [Motilimonas cestriensis]|uniref:DUF3541 domain-containing protein n=1 Tax=Motilimonas cestriensis TaxID=2742685 RepID=A0ABS8W8G8_9GAMM|nr:DUF3541 domain-containing protein [Motilimonas cestriensis]MCE2593675.1 DUF3541 domain-containing protein [Motilimonas cestriensis]